MTWGNRRSACRSPGRRQNGSTAIEFALTFPLMFMLFYGILTYGLIFTARLSLQLAAEEGARAALRHQVVPTGSSQLAQRVVAAVSMATQQSAWLGSWQAPSVTADVCLNSVSCPGGGSSGGVLPTCGAGLSDGCQLVVTVAYAYTSKPLIPTALGMGLLVPSRLIGQARVFLDGRALAI